MLTPSVKIYLSDSQIPDAGRGVFAGQDIAEGEVIELCPAIVVSDEDRNRLMETELLNYYFLWTTEDGGHKAAICLGFGSLYNHSYEPNATYVKEYDDALIEFVALKPISKGQEITVNYNHGDPNDKSPLWIKSIKPYENGSVSA